MPEIFIVKVPASVLLTLCQLTTLVLKTNVMNYVDWPEVKGVTVIEYTMSD